MQKTTAITNDFHSRPAFSFGRGRRFYLSPLAAIAPLISFFIIHQSNGSHYQNSFSGNQTFYTLFLLLAYALPVCSQIMCFPLNKSLGDDIFNQGKTIIEAKLLSHLPSTFITGFLLVLLIGLILSSKYSWSPDSILFFTALMALHGLAFQLMIYVSVRKRWLLCIVCWFLYTLTSYLWPSQILLPPFVMALTLLFQISTQRKGALELLVKRDYFKHAFLGLLLGIVLWGDKLMIIFRGESELHFNTLSFIGMLPAVGISIYYTTRLSPHIHLNLQKTMHSLSHNPIDLFNKKRNLCFNFYVAAIIELLGVGLGTHLFLLFFIEPSINNNLLLFNSTLLALATVILNGTLVLKRYSIFFVVTLSFLVFLLALSAVENLHPEEHQLGILFFWLIFGPILILKAFTAWKRPHWAVLEGLA
jgi:hypothetical protein